MDEQPQHDGNRIADYLLSVSDDGPDISDGRAWFYALISQLTLLIGDQAIEYASLSLDSSYEPQGEVWVFTPTTVVVADVDTTNNKNHIATFAMGRRSLSGLSVESVSSRFVPSNRPWPQRAEVKLEYPNGRSVTLPLTRWASNNADLAKLVPQLADDLNG